MKNKALLFFALLFLVVCSGNAQTFKEFAKQQEKEMAKLAKEQAEGMAKLQKEYDDFVEKEDKAFADYLKKQWEEFNVFKGEKKPADPKPVVPPTIKPKQVPKQLIPKKLVIAPSVVKPSPDIIPITIPKPRIKKTPKPNTPENTVSFSFYGAKDEVVIKKNLIVKYVGTIGEKGIAAHYLKLSKADYDRTIDDLLLLKQKYNLSDWGYFMLVNTFASSVFEDKASSDMLSWFLLGKSGYLAKIGYSGSNTSLMLPASQEIYQLSYVRINKVKYYMTTKLQGSIYTYKKNNRNSGAVFGLSMKSPVNLFETVKTRNITFAHQGKTYTIPVKYNANLIDFYNDYPSMKFNHYFDAGVSSITKQSLSEALIPILEGQSPEESTKLLMSFLHKGFKYATDDEQFGKEKYFFVEEAFAYPKCDCEDRSVLLSYLVNAFVGRKTIGLHYPGHMAMAVHFERPQGEYVEYSGVQYTICDPTYIGAPIGMAMPKFKNAGIKVVPVKSLLAYGQREEEIWQNIGKAGGMRALANGDVVFDDDDNAYAVGLFKESMTSVVGISLYGPSEKNTMFIAKLNQYNTLEWAKALGETGSEQPVGIVLNGKNEVIASAVFSGKAKFESNYLDAGEKKDVFLTSIKTDYGDINWVKKVGLKSLDKGDGLRYLARFNASGSILSNKTYIDADALTGSGLASAGGNQFIVTGAVNEFKTPSVSKAETSHSAEAASFVDVLKFEMDQLISNETDPSIAGLFAMVNFITDNATPVSGTLAIEALDKYNPGFKSNAPDVYKSINRISYIKNEDGIVRLTTDSKKPIYFDKLKVKNDSRIKVRKLPGGDARIDIIDGLSVGKAFVWFKLNSVTLYRKSGDMLFDYDKDHTKRSFNMKRDFMGMK